MGFGSHYFFQHRYFVHLIHHRSFYQVSIIMTNKKIHPSITHKNQCLSIEIISGLFFHHIVLFFPTFPLSRYNRTPVIMASGRELCYVLLSGILSCYAMSFIILARPTVKHCAILRIGLGISLSICYSAIFTKTNRISRIFNRGVKSVQRPIYTSPLSQIAISFGKFLTCFFFLIHIRKINYHFFYGVKSIFIL